MKKQRYYMTDLERLGASFIYEKMVFKNFFSTHYSGMLMMNGKTYRACVIRNFLGTDYLSGIVEDNQNSRRNREELHKYIMKCMSSGEYPEFEKAILDRTVQKFLFKLLFLICLVFSIYFSTRLYKFPCLDTFISFILPAICCIIAVRAYISACRI